MPRVREHPKRVAALTAVVILACINVYHGSVHAQAERLAIVLGCVLNLVSVLLPWGWAAQTVVAGAFEVLLVVLALRLLHGGNAAVGWLNTATGVGSIAGALIVASVARRKVRVLVWCEGTARRSVYPQDIDGAVAESLRRDPSMSVRRVSWSQSHVNASRVGRSISV